MRFAAVCSGLGLCCTLVGGVGCTEVLEPVRYQPSALQGGSGGGAGSGGAPVGGTTLLPECPLVPTGNGWVSRNQSPCLIQGAWYSYNDCPDSPTDCTRDQWPGRGEFPNEGGRMCSRGTTAAPATEAALTQQWGAGIALNLNQPEDTDLQLPIGDMGQPISGFRFVLTGNLSELRVNFPTADTLRAAHYVTLTRNGIHEVRFLDAEQGPWAVAPTALDWGDVFAIQFQVPARVGESFAFDFCVEALTALR